MAKNSKPPTQVQDRSAISGRFVTPGYAAKHPNTTEREHVPHPERK